MKTMKIVIEGRTKVRAPVNPSRVIRPAKGGGYRRSSRHQERHDD